MPEPERIHGTPSARAWTRLRLRVPAPLAAVLLAVILAPTACADGGGGFGGVEVPDRETFVATYVDLRVAALTAPGDTLGEEVRTRILAEHGVTEEQLLAFVERHGEDLQFMRGVWDEVETRLDAIRPRAEDTAR